MKLNDMILALKELKGWEGLPYCIEEPMGVEGLGVVTDDLLENLITLIEFVKGLPFDLEQHKEKVRSASYDSDLFDGAINQGLDRAIGHIEDFVNALENSEIDTIEEND